MSDTASTSLQIPQRPKRNFVAEDFVPAQWQVIKPYYTDLTNREINSPDDLKKWILNWSELDAVLGEHTRWIYVKSTVDTSDETAKADLKNFYGTIYPQMAAYEQKLKELLIKSPYKNSLDQHLYANTLKKVEKAASLFREENIPLLSELSLKQNKFDEISGVQSITYNERELTFQQAATFLKNTDRSVRQEVYELIKERRARDIEVLDNLLSELIAMRHKIAVNAGYENFIQYRFDELGRFDYKPEDCIQFHESVKKVVMPLLNQMAETRKEKLGYDSLKPWDLEVDTSGKEALVPFSSDEDMVEKTIECFNQLHPYFAERIAIMREMNYLDLGSRMHKSPGGYNMSMPEIGVPFIFMNSANSERDLVTMVHEGGHAVHTFLSHPLEITAFKELTSEIAEVASMGMELMSMEHWDIFYPETDELKRAKQSQLSNVLNLLSKTCLGDSFQFWLYANPNHTVEERRNKWKELTQQYSPQVIDWSDDEMALLTGYQRILHFYIVPFYYIEYAFAQLGALTLWKNFKTDKDKTIKQYMDALSLGGTQPIPVFYETAGLKFAFDEDYVSYLMDFVKKELTKL